jgi:glutamine cyclotransferase
MSVRNRKSANKKADTNEQRLPSQPTSKPNQTVSNLALGALGALLFAVIAFGVSIVIDLRNQSTVHKAVPQIVPDTLLETPTNNDTLIETIAAIGSFELLETRFHDPSAFSQGFCIHNNTLYESTGHYEGQSSIRVVDLESGTVVKHVSLDDQYFGEGLAHYPAVENSNDSYQLVQLTWKEQTGFIYDLDLNRLKEFSFTTHTKEGWGITYRPHEFLVSDGSHFIMTWDVDTNKELKRVPVTLQHRGMRTPMELQRLNELEWDRHQSRTLLANIWFQDVILRIDLNTGHVITVYDLATLYENRSAGADVLNGIAITDEPNVVWVTGKLWPHMYKIRLIEPKTRPMVQ